MANQKLRSAKKAKNDEFYTQYEDIEKEINAYLEYDPLVFKNKIVLLPCDDPEWSNFTKYFAENFMRLGLKKLISTSYAINSKEYKEGYQLSLMERNSSRFDKNKTKTKGKIFTLSLNKNEIVKINDLQWDYLDGDGDFRGQEIQKLRDEADIIVTNPPFSLFRDFLAWINEANKSFIIISNKNCITFKEVFPLFKNNQMWSGRTDWSGGMWFETKNKNDVDKVINGKNMKNVSAIWLTNLEHGRRHTPLNLMTMRDNLKFSRHKKIKGKESYEKYDNYNAIEVSYTDAIPSDYSGIMGVPISFLDKYCPEQFEIVGNDYEIKMGNLPDLVDSNWKGKLDRAYINGERIYSRIFIKHR